MTSSNCGATVAPIGRLSVPAGIAREYADLKGLGITRKVAERRGFVDASKFSGRLGLLRIRVFAANDRRVRGISGLKGALS